MCGIAGVYNFDRFAGVSESLLRKMTDLIAHRGPDDSGHYIRNNVGLGHRRLSILDLSSAGHQPMANEDRSVWITYNGECYNYRNFLDTLRGKGHTLVSTSDTEVLIHLYEEYGPEFLKKIDGMYAFGIWDERKQMLLLARDRTGIKPLYYFADEKHLLFASELKALLADPAVSTSLNYNALSDYLHFMSIPDSNGIFAGVRKLNPGHYLVVKDGKVSEHQYWDVSLSDTESFANFDAACDRFEGLFQDTVTSHLISDVPVGSFLSGGVDSSSVAVMASHANPDPLLTFTCAFGKSDFDESPYARQVAELIKARHHEFRLEPHIVEELPKIVYHADEPFAISSSFGLWSLSKLASQQVKVVLTGDGADEVFAGYPWRHSDFEDLRRFFPPPFSRVVGAVDRRLDRFGLRPAFHSIMHGAGEFFGNIPDAGTRYIDHFSCNRQPDLQSLLTAETFRLVAGAWQENAARRYFDHAANACALSRKLYTDLKTTLVSEMLTKVDRMTMAFGLEARVPFLDHHLVEWAFRIPSDYKIRGSEGKYIVKKTMARHMPESILFRQKHGFNVPMKSWMRGELRDFTQDILGSASFAARGLFDREAVAKLRNELNAEHNDVSNRVLVLLMLELWFRRFVDERSSFYAE